MSGYLWLLGDRVWACFEDWAFARRLPCLMQSHIIGIYMTMLGGYNCKSLHGVLGLVLPRSHIFLQLMNPPTPPPISIPHAPTSTALPLRAPAPELQGLLLQAPRIWDQSKMGRKWCVVGHDHAVGRVHTRLQSLRLRMLVQACLKLPSNQPSRPQTIGATMGPPPRAHP